VDAVEIPGFEFNELTVGIISTIVKILIVFTLVAQVPPIMVWFERRAPALMQRRKGPNRVGIGPFRLFGLVQPLADAVKLMFKEEVVPDSANKIFFHLAPVFSLFTCLMIAAAIPFGHPVNIMGFTIPLQVVSVDVGFLYIFAFSSIAVYGITLAGWACNNKYSLMGGLRASAQMISYEIPLGMSLIPVVLVYGTLDLNEIVMKQSQVWGIFLPQLMISFVIFLISMFAETNRAPFDLAEAEGELVAGFHTEYGSFKFSLFYFGEYVSMFILSCLASTVFFGGWNIPFVTYDMLMSTFNNQAIVALIGFVSLMLKATFFMWLFVWVRWTLPRFRYDQLMNLGWKFMMPMALANIVITAVVMAFYLW
jgi:NADH-quinone oxidoreductase subunit H